MENIRRSSSCHNFGSDKVLRDNILLGGSTCQRVDGSGGLDRQIDRWIGQMDDWIGQMDDWIGQMDDWIGQMDYWIGQMDDWIGQMDDWIGYRSDGQIQWIGYLDPMDGWMGGLNGFEGWIR